MTFSCIAVQFWPSGVTRSFPAGSPPIRVGNHVLLKPPPGQAFYFRGPKLSRLAAYEVIEEVNGLIRAGMEKAGVPDQLRELYFPEIPPSLSLRDVFCPETWWDPTIPFSWA